MRISRIAAEELPARSRQTLPPRACRRRAQKVAARLMEALETRTLLSVKYDFDWQLDYIPVRPITVPKGTRFDVSAGFDNSTNNRFNPNPTASVRWGDQCFDEMMANFFEVAYDTKLDPSQLLVKANQGVQRVVAPE